MRVDLAPRLGTTPERQPNYGVSAVNLPTRDFASPLPMAPLLLLEQYTLRHPEQVLLVHALVAGSSEQVIVFRGFSSSLTGSTAFDPDVPVLPAEANIQTIDILRAPYQPDQPQYLERSVNWEDMAQRLQPAEEEY